MIASRVPTEKDLREALEERGFEATDETTETSRFWRNKSTGQYIQVPNSVQGFYPSWLLSDLEEQIGKLNLWSWFGKPH